MIDFIFDQEYQQHNIASIKSIRGFPTRQRDSNLSELLNRETREAIGFLIAEVNLRSESRSRNTNAFCQLCVARRAVDTQNGKHSN